MTDEVLAARLTRLADPYDAVNDSATEFAWSYVGHVGPEPGELVLTKQIVAVPRRHPAGGEHERRLDQQRPKVQASVELAADQSPRVGPRPDLQDL